MNVLNGDYIYHDRLVGLALRAGAMMEQMRGEVTAALKAGKPDQVITATDEAISTMLRIELGENLIEEESIDALDDAQVRRMMTMDEMFIGDPIDGTSCYALNMGTEGVTIGVYRRGVPIAGVIYCPTMATPYAHLTGETPQGILVYAERVNQSYRGYYRIGNGPEIPLSDRPVSLHPDSKGAFFVTPYNFYRDYFPLAPLKPWHEHACVGTVVMMALGRICGTFFMDALWDKAGAMAIWRACGLVAINIETGDVLTGLRPENYQREPTKKWQIVAPHLVCHPANVADLCAHLHSLGGRRLRIPGYA